MMIPADCVAARISPVPNVPSVIRVSRDGPQTRSRAAFHTPAATPCRCVAACHGFDAPERRPGSEPERLHVTRHRAQQLRPIQLGYQAVGKSAVAVDLYRHLPGWTSELFGNLLDLGVGVRGAQPKLWRPRVERDPVRSGTPRGR